MTASCISQEMREELERQQEQQEATPEAPNQQNPWIMEVSWTAGQEVSRQGVTLVRTRSIVVTLGYFGYCAMMCLPQNSWLKSKRLLLANPYITLPLRI